MPATTAENLAREAGVRRADPLLIGSRNVRMQDGFSSVHVIGYRIGGLGAPPPLEGRRPTGGGEGAVDKKLGTGLGGSLKPAGRPFKVVGPFGDCTYYGGTPAADHS